MKTYTVLLALVMGGMVVAAEEKPAETKPAVNPVADMLTKAQMQEGWICLFDGQTPFGWKIDGDGKVVDGALVLGGEKATTAETTTRFGQLDLKLKYSLAGDKPCEIVLNGKGTKLAANPNARFETEEHVEKMLTSVVFRVPAGAKLVIQSVVLKPVGLKPIFNGKDLTGWKPVPDHQSVFTVTDKGEINVKNGGGDLQSAWQGDDFVLQLGAIAHGENLNSGIFFRALPGEFWQGYEMQVRNQWEGDDRTKPVDYGTGGIYNRQPTRRVIPGKGEWFTITLATDGPHIATWINGYQCTDYVDKDKDAPSARKGRYLGKGCISIQGHDPTTDLSFRNIRVADLPKK